MTSLPRADAAGLPSASTRPGASADIPPVGGGSPSPVPLSARRTRTRTRLMEAAVTVFAERGVIGSSVEEICEAAGFTRGAFYSNFADKDELVLALIERGIAAEYAAAEDAVAELKALDHGLPATEAVALVLGRLNHGGPTDRTSLLAAQELLLYAARVADLREPYAAFVRACRVQVDTLVREALDLTGLKFVLPVDVALDLLMAAHDHMHQTALFTGVLDPTAMHALIMNLVRQGSSATAGP